MIHCHYLQQICNSFSYQFQHTANQLSCLFQPTANKITCTATLIKQITFRHYNQDICFSHQMVNLTIEQVRALMDNPKYLRNLTLLSHPTHGKTTLIHALNNKAAISLHSKNTHGYCCDRLQDQRVWERKAITANLYYKCGITPAAQDSPEREYIFNVVFSPGHTQNLLDLTAALRVSDGALIVVDSLQGISAQTKALLRQALQERVKPVLMLNKIDKPIMELNLDGQAIYQSFLKVVEQVSEVISIHGSGDMGDLRVDPAIGNVAFGSAKGEWAFTVIKFARIYAKKFGIPADKMMNKLWGENYFYAASKKWTTQGLTAEGDPIKRAFVMFIMDPICKLTKAIMDGQAELYLKMIEILGISLSQSDKELTGKQLLRTVMNKWLPAADSLLEMAVLHLPSPCQAQPYRTSLLFEGADPIAQGIAESLRNCDPKGPLMVFISRMIPAADKGRFYAFGRIFSGTVSSGQKVRILGLQYKSGSKVDLFQKNIGRVLAVLGQKYQTIPDIPCGNIVAFAGIDAYLVKSGTITGIDYPESYPIRALKYSTSPIVSVEVKPKNAADLPKVVQGLKRLAKSDPLIIYEFNQNGDNVLFACNQLHLEMSLSELQDNTRCDIIKSAPMVSYKEIMTAESSQTVMTKSANKHNRIYGTSAPLNHDAIKLLESSVKTGASDIKSLGQRLIEELSWEKDQASKIWCFGAQDTGPNILNTGPNMLIDMTKGIQHVSEVKESMVCAFQWVSKQGVLCQESTRGMKFNVVDLQLCADAIHRGGGQIIPASRRLYYGLQLLSQPTLVEPIFSCEITATSDCLAGVYQTLNHRRGIVLEETPMTGKMSLVKSYLPASESFGFSELLRMNTQGKAVSHCIFDHWEKIMGMPLLDPKAEELVLQIRKRKGLKPELPQLIDYFDKL